MINGIYGLYNINSYNSIYKLSRTQSNYNTSNILGLRNNYFNYGNYRNTAYSLYDNNNSSFIKDYNTKLTDLKEKSLKLSYTNSKSVLNNSAVVSSNEKVLTAKNFFKIDENASYNVKVSQIAKSQVNKTKELDSNTMSTMTDGNININIGKKNYSFSVNTYGKTNQSVLTDLASKINKYDIGVTASVSQKDGKSILSIIGKETGKDKTFTISGSTDFMAKTGLAAVSQASQDAIYSVSKNGKTTVDNKVSSTNEVDIDGYKVSATLKDVGDATIKTGIDKNAITSSLKDFVSSYNSTIEFLSDNSYKGTGVSRQLSRLEIPDSYSQSFNAIGISKNKDGTLQIDDNALSTALNKDVNSVERQMRNLSIAFSAVDRNVTTALRQPSASLIDNSLTGNGFYTSQNNYNSFYNSLNLLNQYGRSGNYGLMNYGAIGMFLNMYA